MLRLKEDPETKELKISVDPGPKNLCDLSWLWLLCRAILDAKKFESWKSWCKQYHGANIIPDRNRCSCVTINIYKPCNACNVSVALVARIWSQNDSWTKVPKGGGAELGRAFLRLPKSKTQWLSAQIWREETQAAAYGDLGDLVSWQIC